MQMKNKIICVNCKIHKEKDIVNNSIEEVSQQTLETYKTNSDLNKAEIKLHSFDKSKNTNNLKVQSVTKKEEPKTNSNNRFNGTFFNSSIPKRTQSQFGGSMQRQRTLGSQIPQIKELDDSMSIHSGSKQDFIANSISSNSRNFQLVDDINSIYHFTVTIITSFVETNKKLDLCSHLGFLASV